MVCKLFTNWQICGCFQFEVLWIAILLRSRSARVWLPLTEQNHKIPEFEQIWTIIQPNSSSNKKNKYKNTYIQFCSICDSLMVKTDWNPRISGYSFVLLLLLVLFKSVCFFPLETFCLELFTQYHSGQTAFLRLQVPWPLQSWASLESHLWKIFVPCSQGKTLTCLPGNLGIHCESVGFCEQIYCPSLYFTPRHLIPDLPFPLQTHLSSFICCLYSSRLQISPKFMRILSTFPDSVLHWGRFSREESKISLVEMSNCFETISYVK